MTITRLRVDGVAAPRGAARTGLRFSWTTDDGAPCSVLVRVDGVEFWRSEPLRDPWVRLPEDLELPGMTVIEWSVEDGATTTSASLVTVPAERDWAAASWIGHPRPSSDWPSRGGCGTGEFAAPVFSCLLPEGAPVRRALLAVAAGGHADVRVDSVLATDEVLSPGTTHWDRRVEVVVHDLTDRVRTGRELSLEVGRGFFGMSNANVWSWERAPWHAEPCVRAVLHLEHEDGSRTVVPTGPSWTVRRSSTLLDDLYAGEVVDLRHRGEEFPAAEVAGPAGELVPRRGQPSRVVQDLPFVTVREPVAGEFVVEFERVLSGWVRLRVDGPVGATVRIRYGERLRPDGLPNADDEKDYFTDGFQTDELTLPGGPVEWEPRFSYKGFRYVQLSGWPDPAGPGPGDVVGRVVHTDAARTAEFVVADPLLQWIHDATVVTMENNLHGYPTDTPKYEKNGWTGDALVGADMFLTNLDAAPVLGSWVRSLAETAHPVPALIAPNAGVFGVDTRAPVWHAALLTVPWDLYRHLGDQAFLAENWERAAAYARYELDRSPEGIADTILGDWVAPGTDPGGGNPPEDSRIPATAFLVRILDVASWTAGELVLPAEAAWFADRAADVRRAFVQEFLDPESGLVSGPDDGGFRQTHHVLALAFDLVEDPVVRRRVADALAADVRDRDDHLDTGAIGTKWLLPVLTEAGFADLAVRVARQVTPPSWGAWWRAGATTTFEHWDLAARSHGHYFLGTVDDWLTGHVAGLRPLEPGWRSFAVDPRCTEFIASASLSVDTPYGSAAVSWSHEDGGVRVEFDVPQGSRAVLAGSREFGPGHHVATLPG